MRFVTLKAIAIATTIMLTLPNSASAQQSSRDDWAQYGRYAQANAALKESPRVVFMGNSITDQWVNVSPTFWKEHPDFAGRGISGQTTLEMLCRFRQDVINLHPKMVCILAGINDIARNDGYISPENTLSNIISMVELARANDIKVALCSILPCDKFSWRPEMKPADEVVKLNEMIKNYVKTLNKKDVVFVNYYPALHNGNGGMESQYTTDHCHLTPAGYEKLEAIIMPIIDKLAK